MKKNFLSFITMVTVTALLFLGVSARAQDGGGRPAGPEFEPYGLQGYTLKQLLDFVGQRHNDYQDFMYTQLNNNPDILTSKQLQEFLKKNTQNFFAPLGITPQNNPIATPFDLTADYFDSVQYSSKAMQIVNDLRTLQMNYDASNHAQTLQALNELRQQALDLPDFAEAVKVGIPVSVAIYSYAYWYENIGKWQAVFVRCGVAKCDVSLKKLAGADIKGGVGGAASGGVTLGPPGAVAGGLLVAATGSTFNILKQALDCADGVLGRVWHWLTDWI